MDNVKEPKAEPVSILSSECELILKTIDKFSFYWFIWNTTDKEIFNKLKSQSLAVHSVKTGELLVFSQSENYEDYCKNLYRARYMPKKLIDSSGQSGIVFRPSIEDIAEMTKTQVNTEKAGSIRYRALVRLNKKVDFYS